MNWTENTTSEGVENNVYVLVVGENYMDQYMEIYSMMAVEGQEVVMDNAWWKLVAATLEVGGPQAEKSEEFSIEVELKKLCVLKAVKLTPATLQQGGCTIQHGLSEVLGCNRAW